TVVLTQGVLVVVQQELENSAEVAIVIIPALQVVVIRKGLERRRRQQEHSGGLARMQNLLRQDGRLVLVLWVEQFPEALILIEAVNAGVDIAATASDQGAPPFRNQLQTGAMSAFFRPAIAPLRKLNHGFVHASEFAARQVRIHPVLGW